MKIVTNDYHCGTSSSILDYNITDVVISSETNYEHVFNIDDDILFIGHDFLYYLWDNPIKIDRWKSHKYGKAVWCFERIDSIFQSWYEKSHASIGAIKKFTDEIYACDEDDCDAYGYTWLPQWASNKFYEAKAADVIYDKILFSGQAGIPDYPLRNQLLNDIFLDADIKNDFVITNIQRTLSWEDYIKNFLSYKAILNPVGTFCGLNVRAYESLYSGRPLLQHCYKNYHRHEKLLDDVPGILFFKSFKDLKQIIVSSSFTDTIFSSQQVYEKHNLFARMKSIGYSIK